MMKKLIIISCLVFILILSFSLVVQADEIQNIPYGVNFSIDSIYRCANDGVVNIYLTGDDGITSVSLYYIDLLRIQQYIEMRNLNVDEFPNNSDDYILYVFEISQLTPPDLSDTYTNSGIVIPILRKALEKSNNTTDNELQQSYNELQQSYNELQQTYNTLSDENFLLKAQLMSVNEGYVILSDNYNRLYDENEVLQQSYNTLVDEKDTISEELEFYESEYHTLIDLGIEAQNEIERLTNANNLLSSEIEYLKSNNSALYDKGYSDAQKNSQALESGLITIFSAPMYIFGQVFNYEILGVNILSLIQVILTLCIVVFVVKKMR